MLDRTVPPVAHAVEHVQLIEAQEHSLNNGIPVYLLQAGTQPVMRLELVFDAGKLRESAPSVSYFTAKMLLEGTQHTSSQAIWDRFESLGVFAEALPGFDNITLSLHLLSKNLNQILPLLAEIIAAPLFGESELENLKRIKRQQLQVDLERNNYLASRKFRSIIFGPHHNYGKSMELDHIQGVHPDSLRRHFEKHVQGNFQLFVAGQWDGDILNTLEQYLGNLEITHIQNKLPDLPSYQPHEYLMDREDSLQSTLRVGMPTISRHHHDYFKLMLANELLGGYFGSRLMKNIREDKGYTYGIHAALSHLKHGSMWIVGAEVKKEFRAPTLFEIRREIKILQQHLVDKEELHTVTNYLAGAFAGEVDSPFALLDKFKMIHFAGLDYGFYDRFFAALKTTTPQDILEASTNYFNTDQLSQVIVG